MSPQNNLNAKFPSIGGVRKGRGSLNAETIDKLQNPSDITSVSKKFPIRNTKNYKNLPYNSKLKNYAKQLRKAGNLAEVLFWNQVKRKQFKSLDFDRQKIIGNYIVDFYYANTNVVVKIDGSSHNNKQANDAKRNVYFQSLGLTVIHVSDVDIKQRLPEVMEMLMKHPAFGSLQNNKAPRLSARISGGFFLKQKKGLQQQPFKF